MTRTWLLILGALATLGFAVIVLVVLPQVVLVDVPVPEQLVPSTVGDIEKDRVARRGREVYIANGCVYCHSQQVRDPAFTTDMERGWGSRPTVPADYVFDRPHLLGTMRTGPDLINVGQRIPDPEWHLIHLYNPRALVDWSIMPPFPYLFEHKTPDQVRAEDPVVEVPEKFRPEGRVVVAKPEALALVEYLLSLKRLYPVPESARARERGLGGDHAGMSPTRSVNTMP